MKFIADKDRLEGETTVTQGGCHIPCAWLAWPIKAPCDHLWTLHGPLQESQKLRHIFNFESLILDQT
jgi:hypothetical protein